MFKDNGMVTVPYFTVSAMDLKRDSKAALYKEEDKWLITPSEVYDANK